MFTTFLMMDATYGVVPPTEPPQPPAWQTFEATAYTADCPGCIGVTKSGVDVRNTVIHEGRRVIAVDPSVVPLGSAVAVRLADGVIIEATAQDTGADIKGARIDVLHKSYDRAIQFGRQTVELRIIDEKEESL